MAALSPVDLGDRIKKLDRIMHPDAQKLLLKMRKIRKAGYQEALLEEMASELKKY